MKMKKTTLLLFIILISQFIFGQTDSVKLYLGGLPVIFNELNFIGKYQSHRKMDNIQLTLKKDSTYKQQWSSCMFWYKAAGRWKVISDTVLLIPDKNKTEIKQNRTQCELVMAQVNKLHINHFSDTLYSLRNFGSGYKMYIPLIKQK